MRFSSNPYLCNMDTVNWRDLIDVTKKEYFMEDDFAESEGKHSELNNNICKYAIKNKMLMTL